MANLTFQEREKKDRYFKEAVEAIHMEAVLRSAGIDPERLNEAWEDGVRPMTLEAFEAWEEKEPEREAARQAAAEAEAEAEVQAEAEQEAADEEEEGEEVKDEVSEEVKDAEEDEDE